MALGRKEANHDDSLCGGRENSGARKVQVIGIGGMSGSGKTTLARAVAKQLASPAAVIQADWWFKSSSRFQSCSQSSHCWELPSSVDHAMLAAELKDLVEALRTREIHPSYEMLTPRGTRLVEVTGWQEGLRDDEQMCILLEGFVLFTDQRVVDLLHAALWIDLTFEEGAKRRYVREGGSPTDNGFTAYCETHYQHIVDHHLEFREQQLTHAAGKVGGHIDGSLPEAQLVSEAIAALVPVLGVRL